MNCNVRVAYLFLIDQGRVRILGYSWSRFLTAVVNEVDFLHVGSRENCSLSYEILIAREQSSNGCQIVGCLAKVASPVVHHAEK